MRFSSLVFCGLLVASAVLAHEEEGYGHDGEGKYADYGNTVSTTTVQSGYYGGAEDYGKKEKGGTPTRTRKAFARRGRSRPRPPRRARQEGRRREARRRLQ
ncbi:hypothetical protein L596_014974 [Steinernema carpocapsae]|uniref:Uncharacterized protein n=1 Tax=Steinernema carpocapsae TaxID=34508 RepID=A0A4U5NDK0_STECR|nr:hypothetical protein L596_014974 [Steinernema carpocapsae]